MSPALEAERARLDALRSTLQASARLVADSLSRSRSRDRLFMGARLGLFLASFAGFLIAFMRQDDRLAWFLMVPGAIAFFATVVVHAPHRRELRRLERLAALLGRKLERIDRPARIAERPLDRKAVLAAPLLADSSAPGEGDLTAPLDDTVLDDLALAGPRSSLLGLLDTTRTRLGRWTLMRWMIRPSREPGVIGARAAAARDLSGQCRLRHRLEQDFDEAARHPGDEALPLLGRLDTDCGFGGSAPWIALAGAAGAILLAASFLLGSELLFYGAVAPSILVRIFLRRPMARVPEIRRELLSALPVLELAAAVRHRLEDLQAPSPLMLALRERLDAAVTHPGAPLAGTLRLARLLYFHRSGLIWVLVDWLVLYDANLLNAVTRRLARSREALRGALDATGRVEALLAFATLQEEQSGWIWPEALEASEPVVEVDGLLHPFLPSDRAVANPLRLGGARPTLVVSGSNMSGKSTYLRAAGMALVLGQMGAPVRAAGMRWTPLSVQTDINVRDALDDGKSYFAVEVARVGAMIESAARDRFRIAIIDELFRGTNARERVAAGVEVTLWLSRSGSLAILSTHDHQIAALDDGRDDCPIRSAHFADGISGDMMTFDYRLEGGPARGTNALRVLGLAGYPRDLVQRAIERCANDER